MCVAGLHVSTQPCNHRWYHLVRACSSDRNLSNCPDRLRLEGWETRNENCPWCDGTALELDEATHRLFGNPASSSNSIASPPSSPEIPAMTRAQRSPSAATLSTISSLSRHGSSASAESERGARQRELNDRFHLWLTSHPHEVLPSAMKNYPSTLRDDSNPESDRASIVSAHGVVRGWKKTMKLSRGIFKG